LEEEIYMIRTGTRILATALLVALLAVCSGCSLVGDPLGGTSWKLTGWSISSTDPASVTITIAFKDGQASGNSGVNSYGGPYSAGIGGSLSFGSIAMTQMAGPEPAMRAESAYHALLAQVGSYKVEGATLTLMDKNGNQQLIFTEVK
jgi:heat shock protein HslJ